MGTFSLEGGRRKSYMSQDIAFDMGSLDHQAKKAFRNARAENALKAVKSNQNHAHKENIPTKKLSAL